MRVACFLVVPALLFPAPPSVAQDGSGLSGSEVGPTPSLYRTGTFSGGHSWEQSNGLDAGQWSAGLNFNSTQSRQLGLDTRTRHQRWGNDTGIGSSFADTTSATVESRHSVQYHPTSVSPAMSPVLSGMDLGGNSFSARMSSPALSSPAFSLTGLNPNNQINRHAFEGALPGSLTGSAYMLYGLTHPPDANRFRSLDTFGIPSESTSGQ